MSPWVGWVEWLRLPHRVLWGLTIIVGAMLWGPGWFIDGLGLQQFVGHYREYLGVAFLSLLAPTIPSVFTAVFDRGRTRLTRRRKMSRLRRRLHDLTEDEKQVLRGYVLVGKRTQTLELSSGVTRSLEVAGIIVRASNIGRGVFDEFDHIIQPWAWDYLREHVELLAVPSSSSPLRAAS